jgi:preprotein translocase subunit Sec61beta
MQWKSEKISMPVSSAGILGLSPDMETSGIKIDPRVVVTAAIVFVLIVKIADVLIK